MQSLCIAAQLVRLFKELIQAAKSTVIIIVNKINQSVEDLAELHLITAIAGYHVCVITRYANLLNKMHRPSIPPKTVLCIHVIFSGIPKHSHNFRQIFIRKPTLGLTVHITPLLYTESGELQYGRIDFDE